MLGSIGVTAPITPTLSPPVTITVLPPIRPPSTSACNSGSAEKSRFADRNGMAGSNPLMNRAVTSGPMSKSWVTQGHRVVHATERDRVVQGSFPRQRNAELLGGQEVVTRGERHHATTGRPGLQLFHERHEAGHARIRTIVGQELRLTVVVVQDGEDEGVAPFRVLGRR